MSLLPFLSLNVSIALLSMQGQKALRFHQKYLNLCSEDEQRSYGFGMTWGWVINERISIFVWTIPINYQHDPRSLFPVAAGLHQDSPLTLIPFAIFMDRISKYSREWRVSSLQPIVKRGGGGGGSAPPQIWGCGSQLEKGGSHFG